MPPIPALCVQLCKVPQLNPFLSRSKGTNAFDGEYPVHLLAVLGPQGNLIHLQTRVVSDRVIYVLLCGCDDKVKLLSLYPILTSKYNIGC